MRRYEADLLGVGGEVIGMAMGIANNRQIRIAIEMHRAGQLKILSVRKSFGHPHVAGLLFRRERPALLRFPE